MKIVMLIKIIEFEIPLNGELVLQLFFDLSRLFD